MGTKGSYSGGGGDAGRDLRDDISDWLDAPPAPPPSPPDGDDNTGEPDGDRPLPPEKLLPSIGLFRPRSGAGGGDGPGGMGGGSASTTASGGGTGGGAQRSSARSASTAGRAAAAAYAYRTGDQTALEELGLDYASLRTSDDPIEVTRQIVAAACGPLPEGTIEDDERRIVAAEIAQWVLEQNADGAPPDPVEITREAIALIIFEAVTTETAAALRESGRPSRDLRDAERQIRESAAALAERADLSQNGPTPSEFERAIEQGIETLRAIWVGE
jgi:hypothetical protein